MRFIIPVEIEVEATSPEQAEQNAYELVSQAVFSWRKVYNIKNFTTKGVNFEVVDS